MTSRVYIKLIYSKIIKKKELESGIGFGEIALLYNEKRTATVKAKTDCKIWMLEGKTFKHIIVKQAMTRRNIEINILNKNILFSEIDKFDKLRMVDDLEIKYFKKGDKIIKEGDQPEYFYIIEEVNFTSLNIHCWLL